MRPDQTITKEINALGISSQGLKTFYTLLKTTEQLPPSGYFPKREYDLIVTYFKNKKVLEEDGKPALQNEGWKVFQARWTLEEKLITDCCLMEQDIGWEGGWDPDEKGNGNYVEDSGNEDGFDPVER
ncbi:hypothetical protein HZC30_07615 [Candidatus Woesearchaeota archaeon]|nr:hypothetical protein [Candidatus Woesearchaeota archaeon]